MSLPRQVLPGATYLVTRRCSQRQLLLRPSKATNEVFLFLLAVAAEKFGVKVHAYCVMSNHHHLVVTDPRAQLPAFEQYLDSLVARALNASLGRWESFWAPPTYSAVRLVTPEDVLEKVAYCLANPVAAGLVRHGSEWPGLWSRPGLIGRGSVKASRPEAFFRKEGQLPATVSLELDVPPGFEAEEFRRKLVRRLEELEDAAAAKLGKEGRSFMGARQVLKQKPTSRPKENEPRRGLRPRVACEDKWRRIEALGRLEEFASAYREAWARFSQGARKTLFPHGTYWLRVTLGVPCQAAG